MPTTVANFIPELWLKDTLDILDKTTVCGQLVNKNYTGEITNYGDTVHVTTYADLTTGTYTPGSDMTQSTYSDPMSDLVIDQARYTFFSVDSVHKKQAKPDIANGYKMRAAQAVKEWKDQWIHATMYAGAPASATLGSATVPITLTKDNVYGYTVDMGQLLDDNNAPKDGRFLLANPAFKALLLKSPEFTRATSMGDGVVKTGFIGEIAGFEVYISTNLNTTGSGVSVPFIFATRDFCTVADQLVETDECKIENQFGKKYKALWVGGAKVFTNTASGKGPDKNGGVLYAAV